jgi:hypothetical protein
MAGFTRRFQNNYRPLKEVLVFALPLVFPFAGIALGVLVLLVADGFALPEGCLVDDVLFDMVSKNFVE